MTFRLAMAGVVLLAFFTVQTPVWGATLASAQNPRPEASSSFRLRNNSGVEIVLSAYINQVWHKYTVPARERVLVTVTTPLWLCIDTERPVPVSPSAPDSREKTTNLSRCEDVQATGIVDSWSDDDLYVIHPRTDRSYEICWDRVHHMWKIGEVDKRVCR